MVRMCGVRCTLHPGDEEDAFLFRHTWYTLHPGDEEGASHAFLFRYTWYTLHPGDEEGAVISIDEARPSLRADRTIERATTT